MYAAFDKAMAENDTKELARMKKFANGRDITKEFTRRQICENMSDNSQWVEAGYQGIPLNECGWHACYFPAEGQEITKLGVTINRGCCNMPEKQLVSVLHLPNGKWVAGVSRDYSEIGHNDPYLSIWSERYDTKAEALNNALIDFIESWRRKNKNVKKEDEAVRRAKSLIIVDDTFAEIKPMPKGEVMQLDLFAGQA